MTNIETTIMRPRRNRRAARRHLASSLLAATALAGCTVGPNFTPPAPPIATRYSASPLSVAAAGAGQSAQRLLAGAHPAPDWWAAFGSPDLDRTVALALANNRTLAAADANLAAASEQVAAARGGLYPQLDAGGGVSQTRYGASFLGPEAYSFPRFSAYSAGASVSYDPDLFGGVHRGVEQAAATALEQRAALHAARLDVTGSIVMKALQIASLRAQISVIGTVLSADQQTLDLVRVARASGVVSDMDITTAQSQLDHDHTLLPPLRQQLNEAQDALPILAGKAPAEWPAPDFALDRLSLPRDLPVSVPAALVHQRPDISVAEARLHAASAAVGVATADLYPRFTLTASVAEQGLVGGPAGAAWALIGGISAPLFHGGTLAARKHAAEDSYRAACAQYQQVVLASFQQVADSLHGLSNSADAVHAQLQALASADAALQLTRQGYAVGNAGVLQVVDAQRLRQLAELGLVQARTERFVASARLFLAMGGGVGAPVTMTARAVPDAGARSRKEGLLF